MGIRRESHAGCYVLTCPQSRAIRCSCLRGWAFPHANALKPDIRPISLPYSGPGQQLAPDQFRISQPLAVMDIMKFMATFAVIIALISLGLASVAYWRSGGKQDVKSLQASFQHEMDSLRAKQKELVESASQTLAAAYDRSRQRLSDARENLRQQKEEAAEGLQKQVRLAQEQLEALAGNLEDTAHEAKDLTVSAAHRAEQSIALRVRRIEARATLIMAKTKASRAESAAADKEFERADQLLTEATELLRDARETLDEDQAYDTQLDTIRSSLREATQAVRSQAEDIRMRIEQVIADTDNIVGTLESDETKASEQKP